MAIAHVKMCCLLDGHAHPLQLGGHVAARALAVVGEKQERNVPVAQHSNEIDGPRDELAAAVNDAIHVDQKAFFHDKLLTNRAEACKRRAHAPRGNARRRRSASHCRLGGLKLRAAKAGLTPQGGGSVFPRKHGTNVAACVKIPSS